jgi:hypothetical protein
VPRIRSKRPRRVLDLREPGPELPAATEGAVRLGEARRLLAAHEAGRVTLPAASLAALEASARRWEQIAAGERALAEGGADR